MLLVRIIRLSHLIKQVQFFHQQLLRANGLLSANNQPEVLRLYSRNKCSNTFNTFGFAKKLQDIGWPSL